MNFNLEEIEKGNIIKALSYFEGNKTKASKALGISIKTLYNKLNKYKSIDKVVDTVNT